MISQKTLKLYVYVDGVNDVPFYGDTNGEYEEYILHNGELYETSDGFVFNVRHTNEQIEIGSFRYDAKRMGAAPTISFTLMYEDCLDNFWSENVYATFNGEKYFLKQTPTSSLSNEDARYKHEVELISERVALDNVYFFDAVKNSAENNDAVSNSATFAFFGNIVDFKNKLNASLRYADMQTVENGKVKGWEVIVDDGITSEEMFIPFDGVFFSNAIQESYNTFKIPYYFTGKEIHFGYTDNAIAKEFSYGVDDALLSITKTNANNKVVNRVTATGSSDNIPYYYPNSYPKGEIDLTVSGSLSESDIKIVNKESFQRLYIDEEYTYSGDPSLNTIIKGVDIPSLSVSTPFRDGTATVEKLYIEDKSVDLEVRYNLFFDTETTTDIELSWELVNQCNPIINMTPPLENARGENQLEVKIDSLGIKSSTYQQGGAPSSGIITEKHSYYDSVTYRKNQTSTGKITNKNIDKGIKFSTPSLRGDVTIVVKLKFKTLGNFWTQVPDYFWGQGSKKKPYSDIVITTSVNTRTTGGWKTEDGDSINMDDYGVKFLKNPTYGDSLKYNIVKYVTPSNVLLPPKYRESDGTERFYNATNGTYTDDNGVPIEFVNPYTEGHPREHIIKVEDIKPTIKEAVNTAGLRIDMFSEFAYDEDDNDQTYTDENGEVFFEHPYFFGKLRVMDFNLFDSANENQEMTISFTSGDCGACNFVIGATEDYPQMNPVQVDSNGNLKYKDGRIWCGLEGVAGQAVTDYQDRQQDTSKYEVWVALKKEEETYGMLMPTKNIRPKACTSAKADDGDTFVITGINLPQAYITRAEEKLEREIIKYMYENNVEKFKFSIKFSRIYFEENPDVLELLNENSRIYIWYNGIRYTLYVNSISYYMESGGVLPDITVELDNELTLTQNAMQAAISQVRSEVGSALSNIDVATLGTPYFIRKDQDDEVQGRINFKKGIKFGEGGRVDLYDDNSAKLTIEYLEVTKKATFTSLEIQEKTHVGGQMLISPAAMNCGEVENILDEESGDVVAYRCYMQTKGQGGNEEIFNQFAVGDQAICQTFNAWGSKYYWRLVTAIGEDYIDLSVDDCDEGSDIPEAGDKIIQLGHRTDKTRQAAQVLSAHGETAPAFIMYNGINDYTLEGKEVTGILWNPATQEPQMYSYGNFFFGNREKDENGEFKKDFITFQPNPENPEEKKLFINADVQFGGGSKGLSDLSEWQDLQGEVDTAIKGVQKTVQEVQDQIDGVVENWNDYGAPLLSTEPTKSWIEKGDGELIAHINDTYINIEEYVDDVETPTAGQAWRWCQCDEDSVETESITLSGYIGGPSTRIPIGTLPIKLNYTGNVRVYKNDQLLGTISISSLGNAGTINGLQIRTTTYGLVTIMDTTSNGANVGNIDVEFEYYDYIQVKDNEDNVLNLHWHKIADNDAVRALREAAEATRIAEGAARLNLVPNSNELVGYNVNYGGRPLPIRINEGDVFTFKCESAAKLSGNPDSNEFLIGLSDFATEWFTETPRVSFGKNVTQTLVVKKGVTNQRAFLHFYSVSEDREATVNFTNFSLVKGTTAMATWQDYQGDNGLKNLIDENSDEVVELISESVNGHGDFATLTVNGGEVYTFMAEAAEITRGNDTGFNIGFYDETLKKWVNEGDTVLYVEKGNYVWRTFYVSKDVINTEVKFKIYAGQASQTAGQTLKLTRASLVKGTRPMMVWKQNTDYLTNAFKNGTTKISGGLTMTQAVMVEDESGTVRGMLNGSNWATDSEHGRLIVAAGSEGATEPQLAAATTRIYEDGLLETNNIKATGGNFTGSLKATSFLLDFNNMTYPPEYGAGIIIPPQDIELYAGEGYLKFNNNTTYDAGYFNPGSISFISGDQISESILTADTLRINGASGYGDVEISLSGINMSKGLFKGLRPNTRDVSSGETLTDYDHTVYITGGTINLPSDPPAGQYYRVYHYEKTTLTIVSKGSRMLRRMKGSSITSESQFNSTNIEVIEIHNGGGNWYVTCQRYE